MKNAIVFTLILCGLCFSCSQEQVYKKPVSNSTISKPKPSPMPPPYPVPCGGYWICFDQHSFMSVALKGPGNPNIFPGAYGAAASSGSKVFFAGGHEEGSIGFTLGDVNIYDNSNGAWAHSYLSIPRSHLSGASAGNNVLFAGGVNIHSINPVYGSAPLTYYNRVDIYDVTTYSHYIAELSESRSDMAAASTDSLAFFMGGKTIDGYSSKMDVYDAKSENWIVIEMPRPRAFAGAAVIGTKIYIAGGQNGNGNLTVVDVYDYFTKEWTSLEAPHVHPIAAVTSLKGSIFIAGGEGENTKGWVDVYDTATKNWHSVEISDGRYDIAATAGIDKIIFFGGRLSKLDFSPNVDVFDSKTGTWSVAILSSGTTGVAAATVKDGRCFFMGFLYEYLNYGDALTNILMAIYP